jgi:hypothetical protein
MGLPWGVHMKAHLLNGVGDVGPGESEVLKRVGQAPVRRRVCYESIRHKVDQTRRRHIFNVENPSKAKEKKPRAPASNNITIFRVVTDRRRFTMR